MHYITLKERFECGPKLPILEPGTYIADDYNAGSILQWAKGSLVFPAKKRNYDGSTLVFFSGAIGDAIMLMPAVHALTNKHVIVGVTGIGPSLELLRSQFNGVQYPVAIKEAEQYDDWIYTEDFSKHPDIKNKHLTDIFCELLGVCPENKTPHLVISDDMKAVIAAKYPQTARKRIAVHFHASALIRVYPYMGTVVRDLIEEGFDVYAIGGDGDAVPKIESPYFKDCTKDGLSIMQSAALIDSCAGFIGPDSSLIHVAGALSKPSVGLYGPFSHKLRTAYYPSVFSIQGTLGCDIAPCSHHVRFGKRTPDGAPCAKTGLCQPLMNIDPKQVVAKIKQLISS